MMAISFLMLILAIFCFWLLLNILFPKQPDRSPTQEHRIRITFTNKVERKIAENERYAEENGIFNIAHDATWDTDRNERIASKRICPLCGETMALWDFVHGHGAHYHCLYK